MILLIKVAVFIIPGSSCVEFFRNYGNLYFSWWLTFFLFYFYLQETCNPYDVPISMGIFKILESPLDITTTTIIRRIVSNHEAYQVPLFWTMHLLVLLILLFSLNNIEIAKVLIKLQWKRQTSQWAIAQLALPSPIIMGWRVRSWVQAFKTHWVHV